MRTKEQEAARYGWLTTGQFAKAINSSPDHVRNLIRLGQIKGVMDVALKPAGRPEYRIPQTELDRFLAARELIPTETEEQDTDEQ